MGGNTGFALVSMDSVLRTAPSNTPLNCTKWLGSWVMSILATHGLSLHGDDPISDSHGHLTRVNPARPASRQSRLCIGRVKPRSVGALMRFGSACLRRGLETDRDVVVGEIQLVPEWPPTLRLLRYIHTYT
ncbi:hypothetical protein PCH_Pc12g04580 [Penicillium rubens Wisconsin 54-1255]|uniref:Uncharacterized protein n=1 Tax=Penicillium rubens (strain ATCC 28089 / DSM 1075 / NRRL 1951 / Wisconsin 54-1255) TaxID=500485 RepID=B6GY69_PENRW|nr:hypothetical protein PCH_Pc12g04580 [Penicillium rubens Wisconsin 54-1255]